MLSVGCLLETVQTLPEGIVEKSQNPFVPTEAFVDAEGVIVYSKKCYNLSFEIFRMRYLTIGLWSTPSQNPGGKGGGGLILTHGKTE